MTQLTLAWNHRWPSCRPVGYELRNCARESWVRFHSLPEAKRYADNEVERTQLLRRHNVVLQELASAVAEPSELLVLTYSWSSSREVTLRDDVAQFNAPDAVHWKSVLLDADADGERWTHVHVSQVAWHLGALDELLLSVADDVTWADIAPADFEWVYHPYDGGADVVSTSTSTVSALRSKYRDWLSPHDHGL